MSAPQSNQLKINLAVAAVVVLIASFLPWSRFPLSMIPALAGGGFSDPSSNAAVTVNAWNGQLDFGLLIPNWLVVVAALGVAAAVWLRELAHWRAGFACAIGLACYGLAHVGIELMILLATMGPRNAGPNPADGPSIGVGSLLTFATLGAMLWMTLRQRRNWHDANRSPGTSGPVTGQSPTPAARWGMALLAVALAASVVPGVADFMGLVDHTSSAFFRVYEYLFLINCAAVAAGALLLSRHEPIVQMKRPVRWSSTAVRVCAWLLIGIVAQGPIAVIYRAALRPPADISSSPDWRGTAVWMASLTVAMLALIGWWLMKRRSQHRAKIGNAPARDQSSLVLTMLAGPLAAVLLESLGPPHALSLYLSMVALPIAVLLNVLGGLFFISRIAAEEHEHVLRRLTLVIGALVAMAGAASLIVHPTIIGLRWGLSVSRTVSDIHDVVDLAALAVVMTTLVRTGRRAGGEDRKTPNAPSTPPEASDESRGIAIPRL